MVKVTLDAETFKALASATRLTVLRALDERRKTLTELSKDLDLNKATVHEHLALLMSAGLVKKCDDEGRKWIYYELTWRGEKILHPQETTTFNVLLGLGVAAAGGGLAMLGRSLGWWLAEHQGELEAEADAAASGDAAVLLSEASVSDIESSFAADGNATAERFYADEDTDAAPPADGPDGAYKPEPQGDGSDMAAAGAAGNETMAMDSFNATAHDDHAGSALGFAADPGAEAAGADDAALADDGGIFGGDEDGLVAVAMMACAILFTVLAMLVRRKLKPRGEPAEGP